MYAVIRTGGKQYRVAEGDTIRVERLDGDEGSTLELSDVLMIGGESPKVGTPLVQGASVSAEIVRHERADKIIVFKKKRRKNYRRTAGHRQNHTVLKINGIGGV